MAKTLVLLDIGTQDVDQFTGTFTTMLLVEAGIDDMKLNVVLYHLGHQPADSAAHCRNMMQDFGTAFLGIQSAFKCFNLAPDSAHAPMQPGFFTRSEERSVGQGRVRSCRYRVWRY